MQTAVDILMYTHHHSAYIAQAIKSVLQQSHSEFRLIIIEDGSNDRIAEVVSTFKDKRIQAVVFEQEVGRAHALNWALAEVMSDYIVFTEACDEMMPDRVEKQLASLQKNEKLGVVGADIITDNENLHLKLPLSHEEIVSNMIFGNSLIPGTVMIRSELLLTYGFRFRDRFRYFEFQDLFYRMKDRTRFANFRESLVKTNIDSEANTIHGTEEYRQYAANYFISLLNGVGISPSEKELKLHIDLHDMAHAPKIRQPSNYNKWLEHLGHENEKKKIFPVAHFNHALSQKWRQILTRLMNESESKLKEYLKLNGKSDVEIFFYLLRHKVRRLLDAAIY